MLGGVIVCSLPVYAKDISLVMVTTRYRLERAAPGESGAVCMSCDMNEHTVRPILQGSLSGPSPLCRFSGFWRVRVVYDCLRLLSRCCLIAGRDLVFPTEFRHDQRRNAATSIVAKLLTNVLDAIFVFVAGPGLGSNQLQVHRISNEMGGVFESGMVEHLFGST